MLPFVLFFPVSMHAGAAGAAAGAGFSGVGDPTGFANAAPPPPGLGGGGSAASGVGGGHFPVTTYATFETGVLSKVEGKIRELDAGLPEGVKVRGKRMAAAGGEGVLCVCVCFFASIDRAILLTSEKTSVSVSESSVSLRVFVGVCRNSWHRLR